MKCIHCEKDCTYPQRSDRKCPSCRHAFAFEPRAGDSLSDAAFKAAIDAASSFGSVRFLVDHVYYELARRKRKRGTGRTICFALGGVSLAAAVITPIGGFVGAALFGMLGGILWPSPTLEMPRHAFDALWARWLEVHGMPQGLIVRRLQEPESTPYRAQPEMEQYSFDRAVVCDRAETVDVLLANNFHFENNCAVLSVDGYPRQAFATVRAMLKNNPRLVVYALHDATYAGCLLAHELASNPTWFRGSARVVEIGIRPAHAKKHRGVWRKSSPQPPSKHLTKRERVWLASYSLELAAIRPEQVIKRLYAAIASDTPLREASDYVDVDTGGSYYVDDASFAADASASDGGDDGFG